MTDGMIEHAEARIAFDQECDRERLVAAEKERDELRAWRCAHCEATEKRLAAYENLRAAAGDAAFSLSRGPLKEGYAYHVLMEALDDLDRLDQGQPEPERLTSEEEAMRAAGYMVGDDRLDREKP